MFIAYYTLYLLAYKISAEKTLHVPTDDDFLKMYLRPCKYYPKSAFDRVSQIISLANEMISIKLDYFHSIFLQMITFFKLKQKHSKLYEDLYPNNVAHVFEQVSMIFIKIL